MEVRVARFVYQRVNAGPSILRDLQLLVMHRRVLCPPSDFGYAVYMHLICRIPTACFPPPIHPLYLYVPMHLYTYTYDHVPPLHNVSIAFTSRLILHILHLHVDMYIHYDRGLDHGNANCIHLSSCQQFPSFNSGRVSLEPKKIPSFKFKIIPT